MTPGADWSYAIAAGVRGSAVVASVAGMAGGYVVHAALVAAGVGALLADDATALDVLTLAGAGYLLWLGIAAARRPVSLSAADGPGESAVRAGLRGVAVSGLNPKGLLLFFAVLPQFAVAHAAWPVAAQLRYSEPSTCSRARWSTWRSRSPPAGCCGRAREQPRSSDARPASP